MELQCKQPSADSTLHLLHSQLHPPYAMVAEVNAVKEVVATAAMHCLVASAIYILYGDCLHHAPLHTLTKAHVRKTEQLADSLSALLSLALSPPSLPASAEPHLSALRHGMCAVSALQNPSTSDSRASLLMLLSAAFT
jgi:hypothetical protein